MFKTTIRLAIAAASSWALTALVPGAQAVIITPAAGANDTWVWEATPGASHQADSVSAWSAAVNGPGSERIGLVQFNLSGVTQPITSAAIQLYSHSGQPITQVPAYWVDSSIQPGDLGNLTYADYQNFIQPFQTEFSSLGAITAGNGVGPRVNSYGTTASASTGDLAVLDNIRQAGGTVTVIFRAASGGRDWGDIEVDNAPAKLVLNQTPQEYDNLTLRVNQITGATSIVNPATSTPFSLDGYEIRSSGGHLSPGGLQGFAAQGTPNWDQAAATANGISELNLTSSSAIAAGGSVSLGNAFVPYSSHDLQFDYSKPDHTLAASANIQYFGGLQLVVHTLVGNHGTPVQSIKAVMANPESVPITTDGYTITSASGSLNTAGFNGFAGHNVAGWELVAPSANLLSELNLTSTTAIAGNHGQILGSPYSSGGLADLSFQYNVVGHGIYNGDVVFVTELEGDTNHDGIVDVSDIQLIASSYLQQNVLSGDANFDGIVDISDIQVIAANYLHTLGGGGASIAASVPEPGAVTLLTLGVAFWLPQAWRSRRRNG